MTTSIKAQSQSLFISGGTFVALVGVLLVSSYLIIQRLYDRSGQNELALLALVQLVPISIALIRGHCNYLALVFTAHFVTYTAAKYNYLVNLQHLDTFFPETIRAIEEHIYCYLIICGAYYLCRYLAFFRFAAKEKYQYLIVSKLQLMFLVLYVYSFPFVRPYIPASFLALHYMSYSADVVLLFSVYCPEATKLTFYGKIGVFVATIVSFIDSGSLGMIVNVSGIVFIMACVRQKYWQLILLSVLVYFTGYFESIKHLYRDLTWGHGDIAFVDKVKMLGEVIQADLAMGELSSEEKSGGVDFEENKVTQNLSGIPQDFDRFSRSLERLADESLERVMTYTPPIVPFWAGESYLSIPFIFIPRPLWPDKPTRHFWNKFGREYGYLNEGDYMTSVSVSFLAEGYMNFGYTGMYGVAAFFGVTLALAERMGYYIFRGYYFFPFIVFVTPFLTYASDFGSIIHPFILLFAIMWALRPWLLKLTRRDEYSSY